MSATIYHHLLLSSLHAGEAGLRGLPIRAHGCLERSCPSLARLLHESSHPCIVTIFYSTSPSSPHGCSCLPVSYGVVCDSGTGVQSPDGRKKSPHSLLKKWFFSF
ncbi:MAG: hypothetical protein J3Q66DRAFT_344460 [Benniella sp.]|nr:MAG: hypothetical protein J3Q66DRAFT_344460 [Benniella sp.]